MRATPETAPTEERELPRDGSLDDQNTPVTPVQRPPAIGRNPIETRDQTEEPDVVPRRSTRSRKAPSWMKEYETDSLFFFVEEERM